MDFARDEQALDQKYEYMFGPALLVAPIIEPGMKQREVYAPKTDGGWYNFWTGAQVPPGKSSMTDAPIDKIPLLVRAGSILPIGPAEQYVAQKQANDLEIHVYPGADGDFTLYEDEGTNYNYEHGARSTIHFHWDNQKKKLTIGRREGSFPGMLYYRTFSVKAIGSADARPIAYGGKAVEVLLEKQISQNR
jgi:alpha-D-xyloside xylohydrolase